MDTTMSEVVQFIQENDVKFIRLAFCDIFGNQKNIAIMPTELERAFEQGIHFNSAALRGFLNVEASDLLLFPVPANNPDELLPVLRIQLPGHGWLPAFLSVIQLRWQNRDEKSVSPYFL